MFWYTKTTVQMLLGESYEAWHLFGPVHFFWLSLCAVLTILVLRYFPKMSEKNRRKIMLIVVVLMLADELFKDIPNLITGQFEWECLPFHLCSVNIFISAIHALKPNRKTGTILTCTCFPAALCALLIPNWVALPMGNFMHIHSETIHIMLFLFPVMVLAEGFRPGKQDIPVLAIYLIGLALLDKVINYFLGTNFLFLTHNENNPALILLENLSGRFYNVAIVVLLLAAGSGLAFIWNLIPHKKKEA